MIVIQFISIYASKITPYIVFGFWPTFKVPFKSIICIVLVGLISSFVFGIQHIFNAHF